MPNNLFRPLGHKELLILTKLLGEKLNKLPYKFNYWCPIKLLVHSYLFNSE